MDRVSASSPMPNLIHVFMQQGLSFYHYCIFLHGVRDMIEFIKSCSVMCLTSTTKEDSSFSSEGCDNFAKSCIDITQGSDAQTVSVKGTGDTAECTSEVCTEEGIGCSVFTHATLTDESNDCKLTTENSITEKVPADAILLKSHIGSRSHSINTMEYNNHEESFISHCNVKELGEINSDSKELAHLTGTGSGSPLSLNCGTASASLSDAVKEAHMRNCESVTSTETLQCKMNDLPATIITKKFEKESDQQLIIREKKHELEGTDKTIVQVVVDQCRRRSLHSSNLQQQSSEAAQGSSHVEQKMAHEDNIAEETLERECSVESLRNHNNSIVFSGTISAGDIKTDIPEISITPLTVNDSLRDTKDERNDFNDLGLESSSS